MALYIERDYIKQKETIQKLWFKKAAEQGAPIAQIKLGECYLYGYGVPKNFEEAVKWFRKSADAGEAYAAYRLGYCYETGSGVTKNYDEAVKWYLTSSKDQ